jgi:hypothetical protein
MLLRVIPLRADREKNLQLATDLSRDIRMIFGDAYPVSLKASVYII